MPHNGVQASLEVLASPLPAMPTEREVIGAMIGRIDALNSKVEDILRFARPRTPVIRPADLTPVVNEAVASARAAVPLPAEIRFEPRAIVVRADAEMLRAAILNLLLNALQAGGSPVDIDARLDGGVCRIAVSDRGPGIPEEVLERVFEAFYTTKKAGTGLGLPIVKRMMELQHGTVTLAHREGGGTVAELRVPAVS